MTQRPADGAILEKRVAKIDTQSPANRIYVFRCNETGLYAFTADREGCMLPSQMYPQITWQFEYTLLLRLDGNSWRDQILRVTLDGSQNAVFIWFTRRFTENCLASSHSMTAPL